MSPTSEVYDDGEWAENFFSEKAEDTVRRLLRGETDRLIFARHRIANWSVFAIALSGFSLWKLFTSRVASTNEILFLAGAIIFVLTLGALAVFVSFQIRAASKRETEFAQFLSNQLCKTDVFGWTPYEDFDEVNYRTERFLRRVNNRSERS
jgi:hypothetical protein